MIDPPPMARSHFPTDPDENAASIVNAAELLFACLDAAGARSVAEVGAFHGKSTRELLGWAEGSGARVVAIDPTPEPALQRARRRAQRPRADRADEHRSACRRRRSTSTR